MGGLGRGSRIGARDEFIQLVYHQWVCWLFVGLWIVGGHRGIYVLDLLTQSDNPVWSAPQRSCRLYSPVEKRLILLPLQQPVSRLNA